MDKAIAGLHKEAAKFAHVRRTKNRHKPRCNKASARHGLWSKLGSGWYGEAWVHEYWPEYVFKISGRGGFGDTHWRNNGNAPRLDAWPVFAKHCVDNPSKHLPKIFHFEWVSQGIAWAIMPKYSKSTAPYEPRPATVRRVIQAVGGATDLERLEPWVAGLVELQRKHGLTLDIHGANYMYDTDGNVVIIDPFSTVCEPDWSAHEEWEI